MQHMAHISSHETNVSPLSVQNEQERRDAKTESGQEFIWYAQKNRERAVQSAFSLYMRLKGIKCYIILAYSILSCCTARSATITFMCSWKNSSVPLTKSMGRPYSERMLQIWLKRSGPVPSLRMSR